jgi:hypothetical protein
MSRRVCTTTVSVTSIPWTGNRLSSIHKIISRADALPFTMLLRAAESACGSFPSLLSSTLNLKFGAPLGGSNSSRPGALSILLKQKIIKPY